MLLEYVILCLLHFSSALAQNGKQTTVKTEVDYIPCERGWFLYGDKCYKLGGKKRAGRLSWDKANERCKEDGGTLATVNNKELNDFLMAFLVLDVKNHAWIGLHDKTEEAAYVWEDGTPFEWANWEPGGPRGPESEDCFEMLFRSFREGGDPGQWNDLPCDHNRAYICQTDKSKQSKKFPDPRFCPGSNGAWKYMDSCYAVVTEKMSWKNAEEHCQTKFQGHLVTITDFTVDIFLDYILSNLKQEVWIGIKVEEHAQQKWASGWHVAYNDWAKDQGDFVEGTCVLRSKARLWKTSPCSRKYSFVCETSRIVPPVLPAPSKGAQCPEAPDDWKDLGGEYCYFFDTTSSVNWNQAHFECMRRGGSLVSIHSTEENTVLNPFIKYTKNSLFIGLYRLATHDDVFVWTDGSHLDFTNWNTESGEPNSEYEKCTEMWTSTMAWNDVSCDKTNGYICSVRKHTSNVTEITLESNCTTGVSVQALIGVGVCILLLIALLLVVMYRLRPCDGEERRKRSHPPVPNTSRPKFKFQEIVIKEDGEYENMA